MGAIKTQFVFTRFKKNSVSGLPKTDHQMYVCIFTHRKEFVHIYEYIWTAMPKNSHANNKNLSCNASKIKLRER